MTVLVSRPLACDRCGRISGLRVDGDLSRDGSGPVTVTCGCGNRWQHPDPAFARETAHGRERIVVHHLSAVPGLSS